MSAGKRAAGTVTCTPFAGRSEAVGEVHRPVPRTVVGPDPGRVDHDTCPDLDAAVRALEVADDRPDNGFPGPPQEVLDLGVVGRRRSVPRTPPCGGGQA